ncbi:glycine betaine ABC transporter substrate-binding protein [Halobacillus amylolyticus]|uniref:Glycine/betaine ABC transporter n=1 Tax=Halobacillus amylolyticus TaxID=2932259 RepID=A0ABY4HFM8_9BACI|nr:glycine betaine ABC transporter substrate-binding protein [Halobacillus amylolyticus]UOR13720.1 glycine/betaine ABC transporter [Halobacillus amylolyticus]
MINIKWKNLGIIVGLSLSLVAAGCGQGDTDDTTNNANDSGDEAPNYSEEVEYTITGIEPGAGITELAKNTLEEYENLEGWTLQESSTAGMIGALQEAIQNEEPIVVTGWTPHWIFSQYDLKFLEDPKGTLGKTENINTIVRKGLEEDMPIAYQILDRFHWEPKDMETVMLEAQESSFEEAAKNWVEENSDKVDEWTKGVDKVDGKEIVLVSTLWESERASGNVMKVVLEQQGYEVSLKTVAPAIVFQSIAGADADATVAPWLPTTHGSFYEKYKEDFVDLGENLTGTKNGFVVPEYMDIESIEDLQPKE